uniref:Uncharacterized protein LOC100176636 n=1 Tax=Phallusia mammillata TaxID=59560 RepID=A0A6F9DH66_9ASCI|nr:uncharacterized protein LOC100176636 [Phallusia mammillata]
MVKESTFEEWKEWFVTVNQPSIAEMWRNQPTFLLANVLYLTMAAAALKFAVRNGGWNSRYTYMWFAALLHGIVTECVVYHLPDVNNFWHSQTPIIFVGKRFPLYIVLFYPATITHAFIAAEKLRLPWFVEPFAVGLFDVIIDFPYDIMGIKLLWWTWHDTDPNIADRHYWVPWTSYFFHMGFHSSFAALLCGSRYLLTGSADKQKSSGSFVLEMLCVIITGALSMAAAVIFQMLPIYHGLKDGFGIHSEVILFVVFALYAGIVLWFDRVPSEEARGNYQTPLSWTKRVFNESSLLIAIHYLFYMVLVVFAKPENEKSYGMHEPIGPASVKVDQYATSGVVYTKQKYLDPTNYDEGYFDFRCTELGEVKGTPNITAMPELVGEQWYAVCGIPFSNHAEYIVVVWSFCLLGLYAFYNAHARSARPPTKRKVGKLRGKSD